MILRIYAEMSTNDEWHIGKLADPIATTNTVEAAMVLANFYKGIAISSVPATDDTIDALEANGWRGIFESEGWTIGDFRYVWSSW